MKLTIHKPSDKQVGNVRVSDGVFTKLGILADFKGVSKQAIVRAILEQVIDDVQA